jgi:hypothetical protein
MRRNFLRLNIPPLKKIHLLLGLWLCSLCCCAQTTHHQSLYWLRYQNQLIFSPQLYWCNEFDTRRFFGQDVQNQFILHSRLHYRIKKWDLATGVTSSWAYAAIPEDGYDRSVHEIRPVLEVSYEQPLGKTFLHGRIRTDYRYFEEDPVESVFKESFFVLRTRFRLQARIPLIRDEETTKLSVRVADEIMFNNRENTYDQNRVYITFEYFLQKQLSLEMGWLYIHQQRFGRGEYFDRNVVRFSILHKVFL